MYLGPTSFKRRNITSYCADVLKILEQAASLSERVTANKLVDAWCGKGQPSLRVRDLKAPDLSREDCERVIVDLLLEGVLREDFHFTPYSTISYLLPGPKADLVRAGKQLYMDFREDSKPVKVSHRTHVVKNIAFNKSATVIVCCKIAVRNHNCLFIKPQLGQNVVLWKGRRNAATVVCFKKNVL